MLNFISSSPVQSLVIAGASCALTAVVMKYGPGEVAQSVFDFMRHPVVRVTTIVTSAVIGYQYYGYSPILSLFTTTATYAVIEEMIEYGEGDIIRSVQIAINMLPQIGMTIGIMEMSSYAFFQPIMMGAAVAFLTKELLENRVEGLHSLMTVINNPIAHPLKAMCSIIILGNLMEVILSHSSLSSFLISGASNILITSIASAMIIHGPGKVVQSVLTVVGTAMTVSAGVVTGAVMGIFLGISALMHIFNTNQALFYQIYHHLQAGDYGISLAYVLRG